MRSSTATQIVIDGGKTFTFSLDLAKLCSIESEVGAPYGVILSDLANSPSLNVLCTILRIGTSSGDPLQRAREWAFDGRDHATEMLEALGIPGAAGVIASASGEVLRLEVGEAA